MKTRAKFKCTEFVSDGETSRSSFEPVVSGSAENDEFFKYTPGGEINLFVVNPDVVFKEGKEYYVDFTEAG